MSVSRRSKKRRGRGDASLIVTLISFHSTPLPSSLDPLNLNLLRQPQEEHLLNDESPSSLNASTPRLPPQPPQLITSLPPANLARQLPSSTLADPPSVSQDPTSQRAALDFSQSLPNQSRRGEPPCLLLLLSRRRLKIDPFKRSRRSARWRTEVGSCWRSTRMGIGGLGNSRVDRGGGSEGGRTRRVLWVFAVCVFVVILSVSGSSLLYSRSRSYYNTRYLLRSSLFFLYCL